MEVCKDRDILMLMTSNRVEGWAQLRLHSGKGRKNTERSADNCIKSPAKAHVDNIQSFESTDLVISSPK